MAVFPPARVVMLSDDADSVRKAKADGIQALRVRDYLSGLPDSVSHRLMDLLSAHQVDDLTAPQKHTVFYPGHLDANALDAGVKSGALHTGFFNASAYNYLEASVNVRGMDQPVLIVGREAMNRAVDGDFVAVELLPRSEWRAGADAVLDMDQALKNDDAGGDGEDAEDGVEGDAEDALTERKEERDSAATTQKDPAEAKPTGKVVGMVKRNWRSYVAHVVTSSVSTSAISSLGPTSLFASPVDRKIPRVRIRTRQAKELIGQKILITIDDWPATSRYPDGHFVRALGRAESKEAEQESLLLEHDVPYRPFSKAILDCLPPEGGSWVVPPKEQGGPRWRGRVDLRHENICSIDPPGCQDIDDALHAKRLPNGNIEAGVHIADVSYFVRPGTPMDKEAASRSTTVYLVDKRIDMLPSLLGTNLCSLRPHVERLAFSCVWELSPDAEIVNVRFHKSVIASKEAFTYEDAQKRKDDPSRTDAITDSIRLLNHLAIRLKQKRIDAGALNLASPEVKIHLDSAEMTGPIDVERKALFETNSLVEEFMLLANISVARRIQEAYPQTAVLRRHGQPPAANFEMLAKILKVKKGFELDVSSSRALADSLDKCTDPTLPEFNTLVRIMATRCMLSAEYFCSGAVAADQFGHYGLATDMYTHFTSPIRRYPDVLAHRQLASAIGYEAADPHLSGKAAVEATLANSNRRHRAGQMAGRASVEFYVGLAIGRKNELLSTAAAPATGKGRKAPGEAREEAAAALKSQAFVIRTFRNGIAVFVPEYGLEGLITFDRDCVFDPEAFAVTIPTALSGLQREVTLAVFDSCAVRLGVVRDRNTHRGKVRMALVDAA